MSLHFGILGTIWAPWAHPGGPFWLLGATLTLEDHMEFQHFQMESLIHYVEILGPVYISFLGSRSLKILFCSGLFSGHFFDRFPNRNFDAGDSKVEVSA